MAAFTPFHYDEDIGKEDVVVVCSYGPDNDAAVQEIDLWAREHGYVRSGQHHLNVRRNLNGRTYFYAACYLADQTGIGSGDRAVEPEEQISGGRDKNTPPPSSATLMREHTAERGAELYEQRIRPTIKDDDFGKYVAVDVRANVPLDYEIGSDQITAAERIMARRPDAILYTVRVGYPAVVTMRRRHVWGGA